MIAGYATWLPAAAHPGDEGHAIIRAVLVEAVHDTDGTVAEVFNLDAMRPGIMG
jgi:hypothetical protein